jgi:hypothetical protein
MDYAEFERRVGKTVFFIVKLRGLPPTLLEELAFTWAANNISPDKPTDDLSFHTDTIHGGGSKPSGPNSAPEASIGSRRTLPAGLYVQPCFLVPIRKREGADSFLDTVTVGRTRNHDLVLRHNSVSKFHASLYFDDDRNLHVKDAGSKNRTWHNDQPMTEQTPVVSGDALRFGSVEVVVCDAATLWHVLQNSKT